MHTSVLALLLLLARPDRANVIWLSPPARWPPFDDLRPQKGAQACGVPRQDDASPTRFLVGRSYSVAWRTLPSDPGGLQVHLLRPGQPAVRLFPRGAAWAAADSRAARQRGLSLSFAAECRDCQLQIRQQARYNKSGAVFVSCADVEVARGGPGESGRCRGRGRWRPGWPGCECAAGFDGADCELQVDCRVDSDCGPDGRCVREQDNYVARQCYCPFGRFGRHCERESVIDPNDECFNSAGPHSPRAIHFVSYGLFNHECYRQSVLGETDFLYSRRVDDQLELVLDFQSDSGLFLGWRPEHGDFRCRGVSGEELGNAGVPSADPEDTALSCTDRVWTRVLNGSRTLVRDGFVRGGASALPDWVLGGAESFSAAFGWRSGPRTLLMFRRRPESDEPALDQTLGPGRLLLEFGATSAPSDQRRGDSRGVAHLELLVASAGATPPPPLTLLLAFSAACQHALHA